LLETEKKKKICNQCKKNKGLHNFYNSNSVMFSDSKIPICKGCLKDMMPEDDLDSVKSVLRQIDKPFIIEVWKKAQSSKNHTVGEYFRAVNSLPQYRDLTWDNSIEYNSVVEKEDTTSEKDTPVNDIDEVETDHGTIKVDKALKVKWGNFSNRDIIQMEELYLDMERANDISSPQHKKDLYFYCKLTVLADNALNNGDAGDYEKYNRQLDNLKKNAGFRPIDRKDGSESSGIRSFSQIYSEIEKDGWIEPYDIEANQDIVDRTIMYMENYQHKLYNMEAMHSPPTDTPKVDEGDSDE
jgi:hypothetical protein